MSTNWSPKELLERFLAGVLIASVMTGLVIGIGSMLHSFGDVMTDPGFYRFDREHHLPHGYIRRVRTNLTSLQTALLVYSQHHKGMLPPMTDPSAVQQALLPYVSHHAPFHFINPATKRPFQPNARLSGRKFRQIQHQDQIAAFYDDQPPASYSEVYYVRLDGAVMDTSKAEWPKVLEQSALATDQHAPRLQRN